MKLNPTQTALAITFIGGLILCLGAAWAGHNGLYTSVVTGLESKKWPATSGEITSGKKSSANLWCFPDRQFMFLPYQYVIDEQVYTNADYDVHGPFIGTSEQAAQIANTHPNPVTIYYNPANPAQSVLKPGIAFDLMTRLYLIVASIGLVTAILAAYGLYRSIRSNLGLLRFSPNPSNAPPDE